MAPFLLSKKMNFSYNFLVKKMNHLKTQFFRQLSTDKMLSFKEFMRERFPKKNFKQPSNSKQLPTDIVYEILSYLFEQVDNEFSRGIIFNEKEEGEWWWEEQSEDEEDQGEEVEEYQDYGEEEVEKYQNYGAYHYGHYLNGLQVGTWIGSELEGYEGGCFEEYRREYDQDGNLREEFVNICEGPMRTVYEKDTGYSDSEHPFYLNEGQKNKYYEKIHDEEIYKKMNLFKTN
jgi:hypothetical protein